MTNGEKLQETFPNMRITVCESYVQVMGENYEFNNTYPLAWWNAEYKEPTDKIDCDNTDCNNCVNHKYCDYEPNKSENPTSSDDCISRKAVLKIYDEWFSTCNIADKKESPKAKINALPPVIPISPKGHWREVDTNMYACSKCSHVLTIDPLDNSILEMNTCPFCSAKMEEVEE